MKPAGFRNPHHLPEKLCPTCERAFHWRRKWARSWDEVRYCSEACRNKVAQVRQGKAVPGS
ncbi:MAG: DUF2256 domain-containing protein [Acidobacteriota bacterium]|nr:DUF2256 domain-containing protein [Acidobacteriota bacterium]